MTPRVHRGTLVSGARTAGGKAAADTSRLFWVVLPVHNAGGLAFIEVSGAERACRVG